MNHYVIFLWSQMAYTVVLADNDSRAYELAASIGIERTFDIVSVESLSCTSKVALDETLFQLKSVEFSELF